MNKLYYHFSSEHTLNKISESNTIWFTPLITYSTKNGADDQEFKFGISILAKLLEKKLFVKEHPTDVKNSLDAYIKQTLNADKLYEISIKNQEGTWGILSLTDNPKNKYLHKRYGGECGKKLTVNIKKIKKKLQSASILKVVYYESLKQIELCLERELNQITNLIVKISEIRNSEKTKVSIDLHELGFKLIKRIIIFSLRIKRKSNNNELYFEENETRLVLLLPKKHDIIKFFQDDNGHDYFELTFDSNTLKIEDF